MNYKIKEEKVKEFFETVDELEKLFSERISGLCDVKGYEQARHAYILYRKLLWEAKYLIRDNIKTKENDGHQE